MPSSSANLVHQNQPVLGSAAVDSSPMVQKPLKGHLGSANEDLVLVVMEGELAPTVVERHSRRKSAEQLPRLSFVHLQEAHSKFFQLMQVVILFFHYHRLVHYWMAGLLSPVAAKLRIVYGLNPSVEQEDHVGHLINQPLINLSVTFLIGNFPN